MSPAGNRRANSPKKVPPRTDWLSQAIGKMGAITRILTEGTPRQPWKRRSLLIEQFEPRETPAALITGFSDDTGTLGDRITSDRTITLTGTAAANSLVRLYEGPALLGSATATAQGSWSVTTAPLADGTHAFTATDSATSEYLTGAPFTLKADGSSPYVISKDLGQNWTFEAEYKMNSDNSGGLNTLLSYGMYTDGVLVRTLRSDGLFLKGSDFGFTDLFGGPTTNGNFVSVKVTYANDGTNGTLKVYAGGLLKATAVVPGALNPADKTLRIGSAHHANNEGFDGQVRNIKINTGAESAPSPVFTVSVDASSPTVSMGPVATPRQGDVDSVAVDFSEAVTGLDLSDFALTKNGQPIAMIPNVSGGLPAKYFNNMSLSGNPSLSRTDSTINFDWGGGSPAAQIYSDGFSARWEGFILPQFSQTYTFITETDDGVRLWVDGKLVVNAWWDMGPTRISGTVALTADKPVPIKMEYYENGGGAVARLSWSSSSLAEQIVPSNRLFASVGASLSGSGKSYTLSGLSKLGSGEGDYNLSLAAGAGSDIAGNPSMAASVAWTVDRTAPAAPVIASFSPDTGTVGDRITAKSSLTFSGTGEPNAIVTVKNGSTDLGTTLAGANGTWSFTTANLTDGQRSFTATATDAAGNQSVASSALVVTIDTAAPGAPVISSWSDDTGVPGDGITSDTTITLTGSAEVGANVAIFEDTTVLGTVTAGVNGSWAYTTPVLPEGFHSFRATATDTAGNQSVASSALVVTIDTKAPGAPVISSWSDDAGVLGDGITSDATITLTGGAESGATVRIMDGGTLLGLVTAGANG
ncbi:MAG: Ig-like domain-containing protein, partial [Planctomycetota bacterium]